MRAEGQFTAAHAEANQIELDLTNRMAQTYERYANARFQVERYKNRILPDAKTSLDIVIKGYQQGEFNFLILLTAQRTYVQTNLMFIDAIRQLRSAEVAIEGLLLTSETSADMK